MEDLEDTGAWLEQRAESIQAAFESAGFYYQIGVIVVALLCAWALSSLIRSRVPVFINRPEPKDQRDFRGAIYRAGSLVFPTVCVIIFGTATVLDRKSVV